MAAKGNYIELGDRIYSYDTLLVEPLPDYGFIGNITKYSATTSKHQSKARVKYCRIMIGDVPTGCSSLVALAKERGFLK